MNKFFVHQMVVVGPGADNFVGCSGRIVDVNDGTCEVYVESTSGGFTRTFSKQDLMVEGLFSTNPESATNNCLSELLREARQPAVAILAGAD